MAKKKSKKQEKQKKAYIKVGIGIGCGVLIAIGIMVAVIMSKIEPKKVELTSDQSISVTSLTIAILKERLNGSGTVTEKTCESFREIAKSWDKNTDWFRTSYCSAIMYADYDDTENTSTFTLTDGTHAAIYTFDYNKDYLLDFKFVENTKKGYGILIEAKD